MKKRICSLLLAVCLAASVLALPAAADFSDVTDKTTAQAVETLRLMGVLDGYSDGTFRPEGKLTRAQFCKMAIYMLGGEKELGQYRTLTIFPDVKPSHWAAAYINMAAKGKKIIAGFADGKFYPDRTITAGQAAAILLRLLGYQDADIGSVWPDSAMATAASVGLTDGLSLQGNAALTRAQAAQLFVNLLQAQTKGDGGLPYTLSDEVELLSLDGSTGKLKTSGETYTMARTVASTTLVGSYGRVVLLNGKAVTFLPTAKTSSSNAEAAVVLYEDRSTTGFGELAGRNDYTIYKNGMPATAADLRKNDVAVYNAATNAIRVCDTRVTVYYESCEPTPSAATTIKVLGGTELRVLPTAQDSLAAFKPGQQMTLLLTADGQVAAAVKAEGTAGRGNAVGLVSASGKIEMLCGNTMISLESTAEETYWGKAVRVASTGKGKLSLSTLSGGVSGDLDVTARTLGTRTLADGVLIYQDGVQVNLSQLSDSVIRSSEIGYARLNWNNQVDLIVLGDLNSTTIYGRAVVVRKSTAIDDEDGNDPGDPDWKETYEVTQTLEVVYGDGKSVGPFTTGYAVSSGAYVAVKLNRAKDGYSSLVQLTRVQKVSDSAWIGKTSVLVNGSTYTVPSSVLCYNRDSKDWVTLEQALAYASTADLYVKDGVVRALEVYHQS